MTQLDLLPASALPPSPTRSAGMERLSAFTPAMGKRYAGQRNYDFGPDQRGNISMLSAHVRHRLVLESELAEAALHRHGLQGAEKFVQEVCWRTYWKGWLEQRPSAWVQYRADRDVALARLANTDELAARYNSAITGRTGLACFDAWARELVETGYLHNHARMWFASIWIYTLNLPWVLGADWFLRHLIDGDAASNTLSWRWVCGLQTVGKTYLAWASNINKYTAQRFEMQGYDLASDAPPLDPDLAHPAPTPIAPGGRVTPDLPSTLLVHEDDLHPESWGLPDMDLRQVLVQAAPAPRSAQPVGAQALAFTQGALHDAGARCGQRISAPVQPVETVDAILDAVRQAEARQLIYMAPPQGPLADHWQGLETKATAAGISCVALRRSWDSAFYPHARKGFFNLKKAIPSVLAELGLPV